MIEMVKAFERASGRSVPLQYRPAAARRHRAMLGGSCAGRTEPGLGGDAGHRRNVRRHMAMAVGQSAGCYPTIDKARHDRSAPCCVAGMLGSPQAPKQVRRAAGGGLPRMTAPRVRSSHISRDTACRPPFFPHGRLEINGLSLSAC